MSLEFITEKILRRTAVRLAVEQLEPREVPVVGANALAPVVAPGTGFDGVVRLSTASGTGSGSLLQQGGGHYILTAAHVFNNTPADVRFEMPLGMQSIPITVNVPVAFQTAHPQHNNRVRGANDIGLLRLGDQEAGFTAANRFLVAPFGAQQYGIFTGDPVGKDFTLVGYGQTGVGLDGSHTDEVQRVRILNPAVGGSFTLEFGGAATGPATSITR